MLKQNWISLRVYPRPTKTISQIYLAYLWHLAISQVRPNKPRPPQQARQGRAPRSTILVSWLLTTGNERIVLFPPGEIFSQLFPSSSIFVHLLFPFLPLILPVSVIMDSSNPGSASSYCSPTFSHIPFLILFHFYSPTLPFSPLFFL